MDIAPRILTGHVMHKRFFPKENGFTYGIYYIACALSNLRAMDSGWRFGVNRPALSAFYDKDHGARDGSDLQAWIAAILAARGINADGETVLVCMPRMLNHVFNPVSFWLCHDRAGRLCAVLYEVNNTFGETHSYLCAKAGGIDADTWLEAEKLFHVSPFLPREGSYKFRISMQDDALGIWINYHAADGRLQLATALTGRFLPWSDRVLNQVWRRYPLVSLVALMRIHWHALRLLAKGVRYIKKPLQYKTKLSHNQDGNITKM